MNGTLTKKKQKNQKKKVAKKKPREIVATKGWVELNKDFRGFIGAVKLVLQEKYEEKGVDSSFSLSSVRPLLVEEIEKYRIKESDKAILKLLEYFIARRIIIKRIERENKNDLCVFLGLFGEAGGALSFCFIEEASWEKEFKSFQED